MVQTPSLTLPSECTLSAAWTGVLVDFDPPTPLTAPWFGMGDGSDTAQPLSLGDFGNPI